MAAAMVDSGSAVSTGMDLEELFLFVTALRGGDFGARLSDEGLTGRAQEIVLHLNRFAAQMGQLTGEIARVSGEVAHGKLGGSVEVLIPPGPWKQAVDAFNDMQWAITGQLRDFVKTTKLLAQGDTSRKVTVPCEGETLELREALNATIERMKDKRT
jgi:hypothetical protein